jgi:two-component system sensor histidine kinase YesM
MPGIRWFWKRWMDQKIQVKFFVTYLLLAILPLCVFGAYNQFIIKENIESKADDSFVTITQQITQNIDAYLKQIDKMTLMPFSNPMLHRIVTSGDQIFNSEESVLRNEEEIHLYFTSLQSLEEGIKAIYFVKNDNSVYGYGQGKNIRPENKVENEDWYQQALSSGGALVNSGLRKETQFFSSEGTEDSVVSVARYATNVQTKQKIGVFVVDIDPYIFQFIFKKPETGMVVLTDHNGQIIYSTSRLDADQQRVIIEESQASSGQLYQVKWDEAENKQLGYSHESEYSGWTVTYLVPKKQLYAEMTRINELLIILIVVLTLVLAILAGLVSRSIAFPIIRLSRLMSKVQSGNLSLSYSLTQQDEIGILARSYNDMRLELINLIERIGEEERGKRKAEMEALKAQINPHFIYNTLNAIRMMAIMQNSDTIAKQLGIFIHLMQYCTASDRKWIQIREEIKFLNDYVALLETRYVHKISLEYEVDEAITAGYIIPFLIQPILENAIFHGRNNHEDHQPILIRMTRRDCNLFIDIIDFGKGMTSDQLALLFNNKSRKHGMTGNGLRNIHERIQLEFGNQYGVEVKSVEGSGTTVTVSVPWNVEGD